MGGSVSTRGSDARTSGNTAFKEQRYSDALSFYTQCLTSEIEATGRAVTLTNRSATYAALNAWGLSFADALSAIAADPQWGKAYYRAGLAAMHMQLSRSSLMLLNKAKAFAASAHDMKAQQQVQATIDSLPTSASIGGAFTLGHSSLYVWGSDESAVLGMKKAIVSAQPVDAVRGCAVSAAAVGVMHTVILLLSGELLVWGGNSGGQCGLGFKGDIITQPMYVTALFGRVITSITAGGGHTLALDDCGFCWSWGIGGRGQLGHGDFTDRVAPRHVESLTGQRCVGAAAGFAHSLVLVDDGNVYAWGWNRMGELGVGSFDACSSPSLVALRQVLLVACGGAHSLFVTSNGDTFGCGCNSCGQLGIGSQSDCSSPTQLPALQGWPIAVAVAAEEFSIFIGRDRTVRSCGLNNMGQLGVHAGVQSSDSPISVELPEAVEHAVATQGSVFAVTSSKRILTWGTEDSGVTTLQHQLGISPPSAASIKPRYLDRLAKRSVLALHCGRRHCLAVTAVPCLATFSVLYVIREQVVSGVHPGRCHLLPLKNSSRQAPPSLASDGSLQFSAKCGVKLRLLLQACDESGCPLASGGDKFEAAATCLADGTVSLGAAVVEDNADGTYDISVCLSRSGLHSLTCLFGGLSVSGFPVNICVTGNSMAAPGDFGPCCAVAADINVSGKQMHHDIFHGPQFFLSLPLKLFFCSLFVLPLAAI
jgi:alpha-tubulin suppressor-like RCC1 family protein